MQGIAGAIRNLVSLNPKSVPAICVNSARAVVYQANIAPLIVELSSGEGVRLALSQILLAAHMTGP